MKHTGVDQLLRRVCYIPKIFGAISPKVLDKGNHPWCKLRAFGFLIVLLSAAFWHSYEKYCSFFGVYERPGGERPLLSLSLDTLLSATEEAICIVSVVYASWYKENDSVQLIKVVKEVHEFCRNPQTCKWITRRVMVEMIFAYLYLIPLWGMKVWLWYIPFPIEMTRQYIPHELYYVPIVTNFIVLRAYLLLIRCGFTETNNKFEKMLNTSSDFEAHTYVKIYSKLLFAIARFNSIYGIQILLVCFTAFQCFIYLTYMLMWQSKLGDDMVLWLIAYLQSFGIYLGPLVVFSRSSDEIVREVKRFYGITMHNLIKNVTCNDENVLLKEGLLLLKLHVDNRKNCITAFNFFKFDKKIVLKLIGVVLSYVVIVVQLNME